MANTSIALLHKTKDSLNIGGIEVFNMIELLSFIRTLNLGTFIVIWTSTIFLVILMSLLLHAASQIDKKTVKLSKKVKLLMEALSEKTSKLGDNDI